LDKRWINPDEGAHLMDAVLALDGMVPSIDFGSRQPLYVYANALILKILGINYISGRLLPLICSILVGFLVFLIARMLFDDKVALLSAAFYWMLPLELINSVIVKTEPLVILITCMSMFGLVLFSKNCRPQWLFLAGIFAAMGFYVRQSALIIPVTAFGFLVVFHRGQIFEIIKDSGWFLVGYTCVLVLVVLYYSKFIKIDDIVVRDLTPFGFLIPHGKKLLSLFSFSPETATESATRNSSLAFSLSHDSDPLYYKYVRQALRLHSFLLIGLVFSLIVLCRQILGGKRDQVKEHIMSHSILYLWLFSLCVAYIYFYYARGFYIDYFREFLPPLSIIFSAWLRFSLPSLDKEGVLERLIIAGLCISAIFIFAESSFKFSLGAGVYACISVAIFALLYFARTYESRRRWIVFILILSLTILIILATQLTPLKPYFAGIIPKLVVAGLIIVIPFALLGKKRSVMYRDYIRFATLSFALAAFVVSLTYSTKLLGLRYDSLWSPQSLESTSAYLRAHTKTTARVLSGAVIWELQAQRRPFLNVSHPIAFEKEITQTEKEILETAVTTEPPEVIILDGYTEKTYFRQIAWLNEFLHSKYQLVYSAGPARTSPVETYRLRSTL
jgi:4-amino-4-deoxy-L-arabinose transferase-like glycosyltransferase